MRSMHDFLAGFSSPESVLADINDLFSVLVTDFEKLEIFLFLHKTTLFLYLLVLNKCSLLTLCGTNKYEIMWFWAKLT